MMSFSRLPVRVLARTYLLFIGLVTLAFGMLNVRIHSEFAMGDWLINYSGGFVRRGLFGQLLIPSRRSPVFTWKATSNGSATLECPFR